MTARPSLLDAHWQALKKEHRARAAELLADMRRRGVAEEASVEARRDLAAALARAHWDAGRWGDQASAAALLDELRAHCRHPGTDEAERFELAKALGTAHWDAVRFGDATTASRLLGELRHLVRRGEATEGQRLMLARALANEVRLHGGPRGDAARVESLLRDLRVLTDRPHATEEQRDALARALLDLHHATARGEPSERAAGGRIDDLRALASRPAASPAQHVAYVEALQDAPWEAGWFGTRARQDALLAAVQAAEEAAREVKGAGTRLGDVLVRMHAKVRRARDDVFGDLLLDRLRIMAVRPEAGMEQWLALATAVCDGLWIGGTFANRELAEELVEILTLLTGPIEASARRRVGLAGLLVGAHHRAVRSEDALVSKELLTLLYAWAVRPEATAEEREILAHGLKLADEHARARGDTALAQKIEAALQSVGPPRAAPRTAPLAELAVGP